MIVLRFCQDRGAGPLNSVTCIWSYHILIMLSVFQWPFVRVLGMQEPASVIFSVLNGLAHLCILRYRQFVPSSTPMYYVWHMASIVSSNLLLWITSNILAQMQAFKSTMCRVFLDTPTHPIQQCFLTPIFHFDPTFVKLTFLFQNNKGSSDPYRKTLGGKSLSICIIKCCPSFFPIPIQFHLFLTSVVLCTVTDSLQLSMLNLRFAL